MIELYLTLIDDKNSQLVFTKLYNKYRKLMKYIAKDILKDDQLAEDAVHNAFLKLIKYLNNIDDIDCHKTKALIVVTIESVALDMFRKRKRENIVPDNIIDIKTSYDDIYFGDFETSQISEAISHLNNSYSQVLILRYINDYDEKTIAKVLNISYSAVRKRLQYARNALKKQLEEGRYEK